jgi:hypothetical protein
LNAKAEKFSRGSRAAYLSAAEHLSDCLWEDIEEIVPILVNAAQAIAAMTLW